MQGRNFEELDENTRLTDGMTKTACAIATRSVFLRIGDALILNALRRERRPIEITAAGAALTDVWASCLHVSLRNEWPKRPFGRGDFDAGTLDHAAFNYLWLLPLGSGRSATFGTLIGAGGGFILVPILLLSLPQREVPSASPASRLAVVFFQRPLRLAGRTAAYETGRLQVWHHLRASRRYPERDRGRRLDGVRAAPGFRSLLSAYVLVDRCRNLPVALRDGRSTRRSSNRHGDLT